MAYKNIGIRGKLTIPTVIVVTVCMCLAIIISYLTAKRGLEEVIVKEIRQIRRSTIDNLEYWIARTQTDMKVWSGKDVIKSIFDPTINQTEAQNEINTILQNITTEYGFYESLLIADINGDLIASIFPEQIGKINVGDRGYFKASIAGKMFVSDVIKSRSTGNPVFVVANPIRTTSGVQGVMVGVIDINYFNDRVINKIRLGNNGYVYIYNNKGLVIAHQDKSNVMTLDMNTLIFGREMIRKGRGVIAYEYEGIDKIVAFEPISLNNWTVAVTANTEKTYAPIRRILGVNIAILLIGIAVIFVSIGLVIKFVLKPIHDIESSVHTIIQGDLRHRFRVKSKDEMGKIGLELNALLDSFQEAIDNITRVMSGVAKGDLSTTMAGNYRGELQILQGNINDSLDLLGGLVDQVVGTIGQINAGSSGLSQNASSLAEGTSKQAANLEEISSSMNEVESKAKNNSDSAISAQKLAEQSLEAVQKGSAQMESMHQSMSEIKKTSSEVTKVAKVIEEIAFQTNLLALNAAVEAARAGKYGKGFAVVAEEVRSLASRSSEAAKNTTHLLENSTQEVDKGVSNADHTAKALEEIVNLTEKVHNIIGEIAQTSKEQNNSTNEITKSLAEVNNVVQQNSSIAENASMGIIDLSSQAIKLHEQIKNMKTRKATLPDHTRPNQELEYTRHSLQEELPNSNAALKQLPGNPSPDMLEKKQKMIMLDDDEFGKF